MAIHSSILAWKIPWIEEPGGLQSTGLKRVGYDWACRQMVKYKNQQGSKVIFHLGAVDYLKRKLSKNVQSLSENFSIISDFGENYQCSKTKLILSSQLSSSREFYSSTFSHFSPSINVLWVSSVIWCRKLQLADYLSLAPFFHFLECLIASKQRKLIIYFYQGRCCVCRNQKASQMSWDWRLIQGEELDEVCWAIRAPRDG